MPGDPVSMLVRNSKMTPGEIATIRASYGVDKPWYVQFFVYLKQIFTGDLGTSFLYKRSVISVIGERVPATLILTLPAEIITILIGCYIGVVSAWRRGKKTDIALTGFSMVFYAMPTFWFGIILISFFSCKLGLFPVSGYMTSTLYTLDLGTRIIDVMRHLFLPTVCLVLVMLGEFSLVMRNTLTDVITEDYINTAYAKGLTAKQVLRKHAVPNAMIPVSTVITMSLGFTISGALQVETVFSWPGLGRLMYDALGNRDYPLLQGIFLIISVCVILANFISDVLYYYLDPRVRKGA